MNTCIQMLATTLTRTVTVAAQGLRQVDFRWDVAP